MIYIYTDRPHTAAAIEEIEPFLKSLNFPVTFCGDVMTAFIPPDAHEKCAEKFALMRVKEFRKERSTYKNPPPHFIQEEKQFLSSGAPMTLKEDASNVYEGFLTVKFLRSLIDEEKKNNLHLIITSRLPLTWDEQSFRYHGRTFVCEHPMALISTTGLVEAPAKPKEYYLYEIARQRMKESGFPFFSTPIEENTVLPFLTYDDQKMNECLKGIVLQSIFFLALMEPFCGDKSCRLYNAHWQEEMLEAQVDGKLCGKHRALVEKIAHLV